MLRHSGAQHSKNRHKIIVCANKIIGSNNFACWSSGVFKATQASLPLKGEVLYNSYPFFFGTKKKLCGNRPFSTVIEAILLILKMRIGSQCPLYDLIFFRGSGCYRILLSAIKNRFQIAILHYIIVSINSANTCIFRCYHVFFG